MYQVLEEFNDALTGESVEVAIRGDLFPAGSTVALYPDVRITGGKVTVDRSAAVRRQCTVTVADDEAGSLTALLSGADGGGPAAVEMLLQRGVRQPDGEIILVPLGVFRISQAKTIDQGMPTLEVTGYDRSRTVSRARFTTSYYVAAGTSYITAAQTLIDDRLSFTVPKSIETVAAQTTPSTIVYAEQDDPWQRVMELVGTVGCEAYFDVDGSLRIRDVPDPSLDPIAFEFLDGVTSIILSVEHTRDDEPGYNAVIVSGESGANTTAVVRGIAIDNDPTSPTYYYGPYGQVPEFWADPLATTSAQANSSAAGRLRRIIGLTDTIVLSTVPHPALDVVDVVRVRRAPSALDVTVLIESLTCPLDIGTAMTLTCRARRVL